MRDWPTALLGDALELAYGRSLPKGQRVDTGSIPVYGSNGIAGWHDEALVEVPTVVVGRKGSAGAVQYVDGPCFPIDTTYFVRVKDGFDFNPKFLFYMLRRLDLTRLRTATGVPGLTRDDAYRETIVVPDPDEQEIVVDLLSRADGILQLRQEAMAKADELLYATFIDMFGDPATNPKGWDIRKVSDFVDRFEGGKNLQAGSGTGSPFRILKVSAVTSGSYLESESKPIPDGYEPPEGHIVRVGDMLFSRANTEQLVGATAIVEQTNGTTLLPDKLWRIVWSEPVEGAYMYALFQSPFVRRELSAISSGTSASMRNISQGRLFELELPVAPHEEQIAFAERVAPIRAIQAQQAAALVKAEEALQSLTASLFPF
ncbi:TPA: restriction endonuclease subunit S [Burkholderia vietnamiensis]|uniref:Type I restriction-modification methylase S subunit n=1 Tax=Pandoraea apista TaxID=93218 RepID=A0A5E5P1P9_9BURK|nr:MULTISPECIES: restriction endonuclease subunit S [Burkholderiaceae]MCA8206362.1 restriction endonuclease subunit S [Burkholderia vietnamiensis]VVG70367.1 type I restriction-modification methylase S subunit [Pandoraea apista]HDR8943160.1 restriction endonuclease subunit S [Burkholderia vietnamiensis]HDR9116364.1 restriction endonuclease subunit S [Burkholderia vietnamiensis]HDR9205410.1 restriction endonuclease subunit S [Burkholderia vietnamiensis]